MRPESREGMVAPLEIGSPSREDLPQIVKVEKDAVMKAYANPEKGISPQEIESSYKGSGHAWLEHMMDVQKGNADKNIWVAKQDGKVIGVCQAERDGNGVFIDALYVSPNVQRTGAGTRLIEQVFDWAGPESNIELDVVDYNQQAINFYNKFGFEAQPKIKTPHALVNGKSMTMIRMVRKAQRKAAA